MCELYPVLFSAALGCWEEAAARHLAQGPTVSLQRHQLSVPGVLTFPLRDPPVFRISVMLVRRQNARDQQVVNVQGVAALGVSAVISGIMLSAQRVVLCKYSNVRSSYCSSRHHRSCCSSLGAPRWAMGGAQ